MNPIRKKGINEISFVISQAMDCSVSGLRLIFHGPLATAHPFLYVMHPCLYPHTPSLYPPVPPVGWRSIQLLTILGDLGLIGLMEKKIVK